MNDENGSLILQYHSLNDKISGGTDSWGHHRPDIQQESCPSDGYSHPKSKLTWQNLAHISCDVC